MRHLFNVRAEVLRLAGDIAHGTATYNWRKVDTVVDPAVGVPGEIQCRIDLAFQRPGKDQPQPVVAGRAPDRIGVMFYDTACTIKAGDRIRCITGPVTGTFDIRAVPDPAQGFADAHHMEVQVIEVAQRLPGVFPGVDMEARI